MGEPERCIPTVAVRNPAPSRKKTEMPCNSAMPDFIIAGEKVIIRKSPNHIQNTLLIGDSTSLPGTKILIHPGPESE
jgi:hypothetical protein